jgi:predicted MFS family arabinose efflux permease
MGWIIIKMIKNSEAGTSVAYRRYVLGLLLIVYISNFIDRQILTILFEPIKQELKISDTQLGFLSGIAFALFYAVLGIPLARWADNHSRVRLISVSIAIWSVMTAVFGLAANFIQLVFARVGVGVGEAGCTPPAHSLISDYFPPDSRARALATYSLGIPLGSFLGLVIGGTVNELYGWRAAFMCVGLPGIVLALLMLFTVKEPIRGRYDAQPKSSVVPPIKEVFAHLWGLRSFRHIAFGSALLSVAGYGSATWFPAFLMRSHGLSTGEVGSMLGPVAGLAGFGGTLLGGYLADKYGRRDARWYAWLPAIAIVLGAPFTVTALLADAMLIVMAAVFVSQVAANIWAGPVFSSVQSLAGVRMRSMAAAVLLFVINLIGLGIGPQVIGLASDMLREIYGVDSLRYTLVLIAGVSLWAAAHYAIASKHLRSELAAVEERASLQ